jgi:hypothetical protein
MPDNEMNSIIIHYTSVLNHDQLAANPVPKAAPTIAGLTPAWSQHLSRLDNERCRRTSTFVDRSSDRTCTHAVENIVLAPISIERRVCQVVKDSCLSI